MSAYTVTPSRCHIDLAALRRNFFRLGNPASIMPVIKSDAYGHGLLPVARALDQAGARRFAVGTVDEGMALREAGLGQRIVPLLGAVSPQDWRTAAALDLTPLLTDFEDIEKAAACCPANRPLHVAVKCETGMNRLGFSADDLPALLESLRRFPHMTPVLALSHLSCADMPEEAAYTQAQIRLFADMCATLREAFPDMARSLGNSPAVLGLPETRYEVCRPGLALYGGNAFSGTGRETLGADLEWVMSVSAPILRVRRIKAGQSVSYGRAFVASCDATVAVVAAGYATGLARNLSNRTDLLINGRRVPQVGRVCMGMVMADVSALANVRAGDTAWILGGPAAPGQRPITAQEMADKLDTIPYEILCQMGSANPRVYS
ncbi:alanine racemase [uncultured Desulfovibrio sp.]|uniref:alanine racemase n=1 Tax=uncultured Desulfovibrio sp. TaxID=167968 RepID=UPI00261A6609|nr:alanine racemase [uncultured Desulfovibrio sp.]